MAASRRRGLIAGQPDDVRPGSAPQPTRSTTKITRDPADDAVVLAPGRAGSAAGRRTSRTRTPMRISACSCSVSSRACSRAQTRRSRARSRLEPRHRPPRRLNRRPGRGRARCRQRAQRIAAPVASAAAVLCSSGLGAHRRADQIALHLVAAEAAQPQQLALGLDALGDHPQAEAVAEIDDRAHDHLVVQVVLEVLDEGLVDLQPLHRQPLDVGQRRVAGAEIVDRQADAQLVEVAQALDRGLAVLDDRVLGQLQVERRRGRASSRPAPARSAARCRARGTAPATG